MDTIKAIRDRRSIRKYLKKPIREDFILQLLDAASCAPSAGNQQLWHFIVIDKKETLNEITTFHPNSGMLKNADKAILVCADLIIEKHKGYWILDCSAATENILIAANALGIGACWLGIYPREERITKIKELLYLPKQVMPLSLISLGYPAEHKIKEERFDKSRVHYNTW